MSDALETLRRELETTSRDNEHIVLDTSGWSDDDKQEGFALLMDAAHEGDTRAPEALHLVVTGDALERALDGLTRTAPPAVAVEAAWALHALARGRNFVWVRKALMADHLTGGALDRALGLLLQQGEAAGVMVMLDATEDETVRTQLIEALWRHGRLDLFPTPSWAGLGAFRRALLLPFASFRGPRMERFKRLLMTDPLREGFPVRPWEPPTTGIREGMKTIDRGPEALPTGDGVGEEERQALVLYAAEQAANFGKSRALKALVALSGRTHRDLVEWARHQPLESMRETADALLEELDRSA